MPNLTTCVVYLPQGPDASEYWAIVREALEESGVTDIRPAPMPCQQYTPCQLRPAVISTMEF